MIHILHYSEMFHQKSPEATSMTHFTGRPVVHIPGESRPGLLYGFPTMERKVDADKGWNKSWVDLPLGGSVISMLNSWKTPQLHVQIVYRIIIITSVKPWNKEFSREKMASLMVRPREASPWWGHIIDGTIFAW